MVYGVLEFWEYISVDINCVGLIFITEGIVLIVEALLLYGTSYDHVKLFP